MGEPLVLTLASSFLRERNMRKVTMDITDRDVENTQFLRDVLRARSNAQVISIALSLMRFIVTALLVPNTQILIKNPDGTLDRIVVPELQNITGRYELSS